MIKCCRRLERKLYMEISTINDEKIVKWRDIEKEANIRIIKVVKLKVLIRNINLNFFIYFV